MAEHTEEDHGIGHVVPARILVAVGLGLLVLTWVTVAVAKVELGEANIYVALGIAVLKASLVSLFFMHLRWDRPFNAVIFVGSIFFVALFLALAMTDTRAYSENIFVGDAPKVVETIAEHQEP